MKRVVLFLVVATAACLCGGYVMIESSKQGDGNCVSKIYDLGRMAYDEEKDVPEHCMKASCHKGGHISYEGCTVVGLPQNCKFLEPEVHLPFPKCCKYDYHCR